MGPSALRAAALLGTVLAAFAVGPYYVAQDGAYMLGPYWIPDGEWTRELEAAGAAGRGLVYLSTFHVARVFPSHVTSESNAVQMYRDLLYNLVASYNITGVRSSLIFTSSKEDYEAFRERGIRAVLETSIGAGELVFNVQLYSKILYALNALARGYDVVVSDLDVVLLRDPTPLFAGRPASLLAMSDMDLSRLAAPGAPAPPPADLNTGFYYARSEAGMVLFLAGVLERFKEKSAADESRGLVAMTVSDQRLVNDLAADLRALVAGGPEAPTAGSHPRSLPLLERLARGGGVSLERLDADLFPDGMAFFWERGPQRRGAAPYAVHCNWVPAEAKPFLFREAGLWHLPEPPRPAPLSYDLGPAPPADPLDELAALRLALAAARALGRPLAAPSLPCALNAAAGRLGMGPRCSLSCVLELEYLPSPASPPPFPPSPPRPRGRGRGALAARRPRGGEGAGAEAWLAALGALEGAPPGTALHLAGLAAALPAMRGRRPGEAPLGLPRRPGPPPSGPCSACPATGPPSPPSSASPGPSPRTAPRPPPPPTHPSLAILRPLPALRRALNPRPLPCSHHVPL
eukprot:tig00000808_g4431.t1